MSIGKVVVLGTFVVGAGIIVGSVVNSVKRITDETIKQMGLVHDEAETIQLNKDQFDVK